MDEDYQQTINAVLQLAGQLNKALQARDMTHEAASTSLKRMKNEDAKAEAVESIKCHWCEVAAETQTALKKLVNEMPDIEVPSES